MNTTAPKTNPAADSSHVRVASAVRITSAIRLWPRLIVALLPISLLVQPRVVQGAAPVSKLPLYELKMDPKALADLDRNPGSAKTHPATFLAGGKEYTVAVRYRGDWARTWPKKPLKIFFEKDKEFEGRHCLNLNSEWRDPAFIREALAYHVYAACGVPASACRMVLLHLNGRFYGLYADVEQPDKPLLKRYGLKGASLYKADSHAQRSDERDLGRESSFASHYKKETRKSEGQRDLQLFCHELAVATDVTAFFTNRVDVEKYINIVAQGVVRKYLPLKKEEVTVQLATEGHIVHSELSFYNRAPSATVLEAIEPVTLISISYDNLQQVYEHFPKAERLGRLLVSDMFIKKDFRYFEQLQLSTRERFMDYVKTHPQMLQRVPQKYIASYLNIKPETFSRLKHLVKKRPQRQSS